MIADRLERIGQLVGDAWRGFGHDEQVCAALAVIGTFLAVSITVALVRRGVIVTVWRLR